MAQSNLNSSSTHNSPLLSSLPSTPTTRRTRGSKPDTPDATPPVPPSTPARWSVVSTPMAPPPSTPTSQPPQSPTSPSPIKGRTRPPMPDRVHHVRDRLIATGLYLGDRAIRDKVAWVREGHTDVLVMKTESSNPSDLGSCGTESEGDEDQSSADLQHEAAVLSLIANISAEHFYLTSDGGYRGPTPFCLNLADVKPSCALEKATVVPTDLDFSEGIRNLEWLQQQRATAGYSKRGLFFESSTSRVKVRHPRLFEQKNEASSEAAREISAAFDNDDELGPRFTITHWPCVSEAAKAEIKRMVDTHVVLPIPAYDMHGDLIHPELYRRRLQGALVEVYFTLNHWAISPRKDGTQPGCDVYAADIVSIRVIAPPKPTVVTPRKRKASLVDPFGDIYESPTKKAKMTPMGMGGVC